MIAYLFYAICNSFSFEENQALNVVYVSICCF